MSHINSMSSCAIATLQRVSCGHALSPNIVRYAQSHDRPQTQRQRLSYAMQARSSLINPLQSIFVTSIKLGTIAGHSEVRSLYPAGLSVWREVQRGQPWYSWERLRSMYPHLHTSLPATWIESPFQVVRRKIRCRHLVHGPHALLFLRFSLGKVARVN